MEGDDPAIIRARSRSERGLSRELTQARTLNPPLPSRGGTRGFPIWQRLRALECLAEYGDYELAADRVGCSPLSVRRWERRVIPYRMTGGVERYMMTGADQLLFSICLYIYPNASSDQLCVFMIANGGGVYSRQTITQRCMELGLSRKRSSRESFEAYSAASIQKNIWFWYEPPPLGISDVSRFRLIDVDETGFYLKTINTKYGRAHTTNRVRHPAHYTRSEPKVNVILGVEPGNPLLPPNVDGSIQRPRRWISVTQINCDQFVFGDFIDTMLIDIEQHPVPEGYDNERCIIWDNLAAHKTPYVTTIIRDRPSNNNFYSVDRPPYRPKIAPIEYIFCELAAELALRCTREWNIDELRRNIYDICSTVGSGGRLHSTFVHCGYRNL